MTAFRKILAHFERSRAPQKVHPAPDRCFLLSVDCRGFCVTIYITETFPSSPLSFGRAREGGRVKGNPYPPRSDELIEPNMGASRFFRCRTLTGSFDFSPASRGPHPRPSNRCCNQAGIVPIPPAIPAMRVH